MALTKKCAFTCKVVQLNRIITILGMPLIWEMYASCEFDHVFLLLLNYHGVRCYMASTREHAEMATEISLGPSHPAC